MMASSDRSSVLIIRIWGNKCPKHCKKDVGWKYWLRVFRFKCWLLNPFHYVLMMWLCCDRLCPVLLSQSFVYKLPWRPSYLWNVRGCQSGNVTGQATTTGRCGSEKAVTKELRQRLEGPRFGWRDRPSCDQRVVDWENFAFGCVI